MCEHDVSVVHQPQWDGWVREWCRSCGETLDWHPPK